MFFKMSKVCFLAKKNLINIQGKFTFRRGEPCSVRLNYVVVILKRIVTQLPQQSFGGKNFIWHAVKGFWGKDAGKATFGGTPVVAI